MTPSSRRHSWRCRRTPPFKLEITNAGTTPAEFESLSLHKEKVLAAGTTSSLVFRRLPPGSYDFFDDFHPEAKAVLIAR